MVRARSVSLGISLCFEHRKWKLSSLLIADDAVLFCENEDQLQRLGNEFRKVCKKRIIKVDIEKDKVVVCERNMNMDCKIHLKGKRRMETLLTWYNGQA